MVRKDKRQAIILLAVALLAIFTASAQQKAGQRSNMVRLVKGKSIQIITGDDGKSYRKATEATFLHNDTYLICDTAFWRVDDNIINAKGHVKLMQDGTVLTSETLDYYVDDNLAQFRGTLVQLVDKDNNTLRTRYLDYNTQDSVAVFSKGAAMKDKDGQIIESIDGTYDSKAELFTFRNNVNMFTDSVFIKTSELDFHTDTEKAIFKKAIDFWKDDNMLSAGRGWYNRKEETFFFTEKVHGTSANQEVWSDTLFFYRNVNDVLMLGNVQLQDSTHRTSAVSEYMLYQDSISTVTMMREAAVAIQTDEANPQDTLYFGADTLVYYTIERCDIPENEIKEAESRLSEIMTDPVGEYRKKAAAEASKAAEEAAKNNRNTSASAAAAAAAARKNDKGPDGDEGEPEDMPVGRPAPNDTLPAVSDSLLAQSDSLAVIDSLANVVLPDTTKIGFAMGRGNVLIYRNDIQVRCDSMRYTDLDSIARFYIDPIVWNEGRRQYHSDSLNVLIRNSSVDRASLMGNALIITQEDSVLFDQIKGAEVMAYFDSTTALRRFDALGGSTSIFYLEENETLATVNKVECKMLSGVFVDGTIDRIYYFDSPKNDAYPVVQFPKSDRYLKGFKWVPELKPTGKESITDLTVRPSERAEYEKRPRAKFVQTNIYFPGYMKSVYEAIDESHKPKPKTKDKELLTDEFVLRDTTAKRDFKHLRDSLNTADSLAIADSLALSDSLALGDSLSCADSLAHADSLVQTVAPEKTKAQLKAERKAAREQRKKDRIARKKARWAELDARDAAIEAAKQEKLQQKEREKKRKELEAIKLQEQKDQEKLEKYIKYYEKKKAKEDGKNRR